LGRHHPFDSDYWLVCCAQLSGTFDSVTMPLLSALYAVQGFRHWTLVVNMLHDTGVYETPDMWVAMTSVYNLKIEAITDDN
jgi:hypothetical protein